MSNEVDLTSREWCDLIFEGKNKEWGAYVLRRTSIKRHNIAVLSTIVGIIGVALLAFLVGKAVDQITAVDETEQVEQNLVDLNSITEDNQEEDKPDLTEPEPEKKEVEEVAQQQVTEINIVKDEEVTQPPKLNLEVQEDKSAITSNNVESDLLGGAGAVTDAKPVEAPKPVAVVEEKVQIEEKKPEPATEEVFKSVEQMPQFPGGDAALMKYLGSHIQYPAMAAEQGIEGRCVLQFVVTKSGKVGEVKVARSLSPDCDKEAIRVVKSMPNFTPGRQNGQAVNVWFTLPVTFKLQK